MHLAATSNNGAHHSRISPVGAGFLGAGLTLAVALAIIAALFFMGLLAIGNSKRKGSRTGSEVSYRLDYTNYLAEIILGGVC